jgi:NADH-ubiquinone oxidoreductase chain 4
MTQLMPLFSILFFILCLSNAGTPLSLNFIGEFLSLYGTFERLPIAGALASSSIVFSAAYSMYMYNRIAFAGSFSKYFNFSISDLSKREYYILITLVLFTVFLGLYPSIILDGLHYTSSMVVYAI